MNLATAAAATWPYPHRTVAEIDAGSDWLKHEDRTLRMGLVIGMSFGQIAALIPNRDRAACTTRASSLRKPSLRVA